ncbi:MAG: hypothetical protein IJ600_05575 [Lachnospiraceae bacterium]|nr:hypothetical protein [Lachnospiraceae bacterium]
MQEFNEEEILKRIAEMEDGEESVSEVMTPESLSEDAPKDLRELVGMAGKVIGIEYSGLGENGYDAYGAYCFLPPVEEDACRILSIVVTLTEEVDGIGIYDLYQVMNRINARILGGAFVLSDDESTLYFRRYVYLPTALEPEECIRMAGQRIFDSLAIVAGSIDVLMGLIEATMSYEECLARLGITADEDNM